MHTTHHRNRVRLLHTGLTVLLLLLLTLAASTARSLADTYFEPAPEGPPATVGPYTMTQFPLDTRPADYTPVTSVTGPTGNIQFSRPGLHTRVGDPDLWGHDYTGDVYYFTCEPWDPGLHAARRYYQGEVTLYLPPNTMAISLFVHTEYPGPDGELPTIEASGPHVQATVTQISRGAVLLALSSATGEPMDWLTIGIGGMAPGFVLGEFGIHGWYDPTPRADVSAVIYGGWGGMPVQAWVGGVEQPTLYTAPDEEGEASVLFTFWPPESDAWDVSLKPALPAGLDPEAWELRLVGIRRGNSWGPAPASSEVSVMRGSKVVLYYQLVHTGG